MSNNTKLTAKAEANLVPLATILGATCYILAGIGMYGMYIVWPQGNSNDYAQIGYQNNMAMVLMLLSFTIGGIGSCLLGSRPHKCTCDHCSQMSLRGHSVMGRYCSEECYQAVLAEEQAHIIPTCTWCGEAIDGKPVCGEYCSNICAHLDTSDHVDLVDCTYCGSLTDSPDSVCFKCRATPEWYYAN